ncbi:MAG: TonB-dependent receptor plug domain-containing protein [Gammaproteobacteria bacterium AqS3]|nr:TonB-dependent receptor plug domain-containing protein [Gammaproteobacteria bacterium AqS3]
MIKPVEEIIVTGNAMAWAAGGSVDSVAHSDIARLRPGHPHELFARTKGVWISRGSGQEHLSAIRSPVLTGAGACGSFLVTVNSLPIRPIGFCNVNELFEVQLAGANRVDVIKGPASAVAGGNALHGAINVETPRLGDPRYLDFTAGSHGHRRLVLGNEGRKWRLDTNMLYDPGWRDDSRVSQQQVTLSRNRGQDEDAGTLLIQWNRLNQNTAGYVEDDEENHDVYKDRDLSRANQNPEAFRDANALRASYKMTVYSDGLQRVALTPYMRESDMKFAQHFLPGKPIEENSQNSYGLAWDYQVSEEHQFGGHVETGVVDLEQYQEGPTVILGSSPHRPTGKHYDYSVDFSTVSFFYRLRRQMESSVVLVVDSRLTSIRYDYDNRMVSGSTKEDGTNCVPGVIDSCFYTRPDDRSDSFAGGAQRIALTGMTFAKTRWHVSLAQAFRPPQINELYRLRDAQRHPDLGIESLVGFEAGISGNFKRGGWSLTAFIQNKDNAIYRNSANEYLGSGASEHSGLEWSIGTGAGLYSFDWQGTLARHLYDFDAILGGNQVVKKGHLIDTAPRLMHSLFWRRSGGRSMFEFEAQSIGPYYTGTDNKHQYRGHTLLHAALHWAGKTTPYSYSLKVRNLRNTRYADRADYGFSGPRYFPGAPRSAYLSIRRSIGVSGGDPANEF